MKSNAGGGIGHLNGSAGSGMALSAKCQPAAFMQPGLHGLSACGSSLSSLSGLHGMCQLSVMPASSAGTITILLLMSACLLAAAVKESSALWQLASSL